MAVVKIHGQSGFSLIELLTVCALVGIVSVIGMPLLGQISGAIQLGEAARQVERELQSARITAVSANQPMRVMFNCPAATQYRLVELIGTPGVPAAADGAVGRCSATTYPFPAPDNNPITRPNNDGPLRNLSANVTFTTVTTIEFWPDGYGAHEHRRHESVAADRGGRHEHHPDPRRQNSINFGEWQWQSPTSPISRRDDRKRASRSSR